ncbi:MAG: isoprenylcysteine carboxylmethyltransferase family protein [Solirubrobacterales bacterium]
MAELALVMLGVFGVSLVARIVIQRRRAGGSGLVGLERGAGLLAWLSGVLFIVAIAVGASSPLLVVEDSLETIDRFDGSFGHAVGIVLGGLGIAGVFAAQMGMGNSWRVGVSGEQDTELVTGGLFSLCRNPIYTAMMAAWIGFALMVPTVPAIATVVMVFLALEGTVRLVEEPFMSQAHGDAYAAYQRRVGRFLPGIGTAAPSRAAPGRRG